MSILGDCRSLLSRASRGSETALRAGVRPGQVRSAAGAPPSLDPPPLTAWTYSAPVKNTHGRIQNSATGDRAYQSLSTDVPDLVLQQSQYVGREAHRFLKRLREPKRQMLRGSMQRVPVW